MESESKRVIGIDLAKRSYVAHSIDLVNGKEHSWQGTTDQRGLQSLLRRLEPTDRVGIECCALAMRLAKIIQAQAHSEVILLNAGQLQIIYNTTKKTDQLDAQKLAKLLQRYPIAELPIIKQPSPEEEYHRALVSEHASKRRIRTMLINRLHSLFLREAIVTIAKKHLSKPCNRDKSLTLLSGYTLAEARRVCDEINVIEDHLHEIDLVIHNALKGSDQAARLMSLPGVGPVSAMVFMAFVGDGSRFTKGRQVSNFAGMTPRVDSSGETTKLGGISKRGCKAIRAVIVQAAWVAVMAKNENPLKTKFFELAERRGKGRAIVAIARRLLELMWLVSARKEVYRGMSAVAWQNKLRRLSLKKQGAESAA